MRAGASTGSCAMQDRDCAQAEAALRELLGATRGLRAGRGNMERCSVILLRENRTAQHLSAF